MGQNERYLWLDDRGKINPRDYVYENTAANTAVFFCFYFIITYPDFEKRGDSTMRPIDFYVPYEYDGVSLKGFLRGYCHLSARLFAILKREPLGITKNGGSQQIIATDTLQSGDLISLNFPNDFNHLTPSVIPFTIVYEDESLLAIDKPAGMVLYPSPGHDRDSLANAVSAYCREKGENYAFRPVYRLDRDTTGLVLLAKNPYAASILAGQVKKTYFAVCEGILSGEGVIDEPIGLKEGHSIQQEVSDSGKRAVTRWHSVLTGNGHSLLSLSLPTGRTHQIRVHLSFLGHPLAGDDMYGGSRSLINRQALHCAPVYLTHPVTNGTIRLACGFPDDMKQLIQKLFA